MTEVAEKESTDLITVPSKETALDVFKGEKGLDPYLQTIRQELDAFLASPPSLRSRARTHVFCSTVRYIAVTTRWSAWAACSRPPSKAPSSAWSTVRTVSLRIFAEILTYERAGSCDTRRTTRPDHF